MNSANVVVHIVDDEESVRTSLAFLLDISGFAVRTHASAQAFLDIAPEIQNGCLVTDLRMPDIDGVELLRRLKASGTMLPAIVVTGHGDVQMAVQAMKNGAIDFIEKPFSNETIVMSIRRAVELASSKGDADHAHELVRERLRSSASASCRCSAVSSSDNPTRSSRWSWASVHEPSRCIARD